MLLRGRQAGTGRRRHREGKTGGECCRLFCLEDSRIENMTKNSETSPRSGKYSRFGCDTAPHAAGIAMGAGGQFLGSWN